MAILLVFIAHFRFLAPALPLDRVLANIELLGYIGVDLFFVLSGYLITGILLDTRGAPHYFRNFYIRRALRILPLYYGVVAALVLVLPLVHRHTEALAALQHNQWWYWFHATNFVLGRPGALVYNTGHFWSLAVEEQFYLVWPLIVWWSPPSRLTRVCVACIIGALLLRVASELTGHRWWAFALTPMRMDTLALGALLAVQARRSNGLRTAARWAPIVGISALTVLLVTFFGSQRWPAIAPVHGTLGYSASAILFACVVAAASAGRGARLFTQPVLRFFGKYSYGLYVFHWPLLLFAAPLYAAAARMPLLGGSSILQQIVFFLEATGASVGIAWLSWHLYEQPFLSLKRYFPNERAEAQASDAPRGPSPRR